MGGLINRTCALITCRTDIRYQYHSINSMACGDHNRESPGYKPPRYTCTYSANTCKPTRVFASMSCCRDHSGCNHGVARFLAKHASTWYHHSVPLCRQSCFCTHENQYIEFVRHVALVHASGTLFLLKQPRIIAHVVQQWSRCTITSKS